MEFSISVASSVLAFSIVFATNSFAAQSAAPPALQDVMRSVFQQNASCKGSLSNVKVISTELQPDAKIVERKLVSGEVREIWEATPCGHRTPMRYLFRLKPNKAGELDVFGYEPMRYP